MDTKKIIVTLPVSLFNYAISQGKNLNDGIVNIIKAYKELDAQNITDVDLLMDDIADTVAKMPDFKVPDDVMDALDNITESVETSAIKQGKAFKETSDVVSVIEYSPYSYAIVGDTKPVERREVIKGYEGARFVSRLVKYNNASGWVIQKRNISDINTLIHELEGTGLKVKTGESVVTDEERLEMEDKAKKKKNSEKRPEKVVALKRTEKHQPTVVCVEPAAKNSDSEYQKIERSLKTISGGLYYNYDAKADGSRIYFYVGRFEDDESCQDVYCLIGKIKGDAAKMILPNRDKYDYIIDKGLLKAYEDGVIKSIHKHMIWAYAEIGDVKMVEQLEDACSAA